MDKVQITLFTNEADVAKRIETTRAAYRERDDRLAGLTDEKVETFYSCLLCQSFAPNHVCIITPERSGLCGAYNWLDGKAAHEIKPAGANQPVKKGRIIDPVKGQWAGVNEYVFANSHKTLDVFNAYSIIEFPMTSCGCFECISCVLPTCNGIMTVYREFPDMTPSGMKFSTLAGTVGGGLQSPGFIGHSKHYIVSRKFISTEGGIRRLVWMHKSLKVEMGGPINTLASEHGIENFIDMVADETIANTEEEILEYITSVNHPALSMLALF
jgi:acetyl-CoA synthase